MVWPIFLRGVAVITAFLLLIALAKGEWILALVLALHVFVCATPDRWLPRSGRP